MQSIEGQNETSAPALDDCLNLLRGQTDEQRLAGLLLVTKYCNKDDHDSIRQVYRAIGPQFLHRLLRTGTMGRGSKAGGVSESGDNRDAYLHLCMTVLAALCRVPEIAASTDMVSKIPSVLQVMEKESALSFLEDCYEFLFLMSSASEDALATLFESGGLKLLAAQSSSVPDGSQIAELSMRLIMLIFSKLPLDAIVKRNLTELCILVVFIARQFALLHNALKFDLLHLLCVILSSEHLVPLHNALRGKSNDKWPAYMRAGVMDILQNRVAPDQKLQALIVAESMVSILGERWLISHMDAPNLHKSFPSDRCLLLVLESARVEIAVLLNELAYVKYEASSVNSETLAVKRRNLAIAYSLVEQIIKLISTLSEEEGGIINEGTATKVISGLNETMEVVLDYLKEAKDHGQNKGDDLLASVRVVGSYLAEAPFACKGKVKELSDYLLTVQGENESSPFLSICFLLPMLCQTTMKIEGVNVLASSGAYKAVMECLVRLVDEDPHLVKDNGSIFLACDTVMNFLLKREHIMVQLDESAFIPVLKALAHWTEVTTDISIIMMASSICSLIFGSTSEEALMRYPDIDIDILHRLSQLIVRGLTICGQSMCNDEKSEADLHQIIAAGYSQWAGRFPHVRQIVER